MFYNSNAFRITAFIFIVLTILVTLIKPTLFFSKEGKLKSFGIQYTDQTTPLPFGAFLYGFLIILYIFIIFIDVRLINTISSAKISSVVVPI